MKTKAKYIDMVELVSTPGASNPFYVVKSKNGNHYVSALGGRAAVGLKPGTKLSLYRSESAMMTAYHLERA